MYMRKKSTMYDNISHSICDAHLMMMDWDNEDYDGDDDIAKTYDIGKNIADLQKVIERTSNWQRFLLAFQCAYWFQSHLFNDNL